MNTFDKLMRIQRVAEIDKFRIEHREADGVNGQQFTIAAGLQTVTMNTEVWDFGDLIQVGVPAANQMRIQPGVYDFLLGLAYDNSSTNIRSKTLQMVEVGGGALGYFWRLTDSEAALGYITTNTNIAILYTATIEFTTQTDVEIQVRVAADSNPPKAYTEAGEVERYSFLEGERIRLV